MSILIESRLSPISDMTSGVTLKMWLKHWWVLNPKTQPKYEIVSWICYRKCIADKHSFSSAFESMVQAN
jgi:hypothetical protein